MSMERRGLRWLRRGVAMRPWPFAVAVVGAVVFALAAVGSTVVLGELTDRLIVPAFEDSQRRGVEAQTVWVLMGLVVGVAIARGAGVMVRRYFAGMTSASIQRELSRRLGHHYVSAPLAFHRRERVGTLLAHADADAEVASDAFNPLPFSLGVIALALFSVVSLALVDSWILLVALALFPLLGLLNRRYTREVEGPSGAVQAGVGRVAAVAHESIDGALVVKTLGREENEVERLSGAVEELRDQRLAVGRLRASFEPSLDALPNLGILALLAVGAWRIDVGAISTGQLVQAMALFQVLVFPIRVIGFLFEELPRSVVASERIDRVLARESEAPVGGRRALPPGPLALEVRGLSFAYGPGAPVLDGLDLELEAGEVLALVGSTGSGKSTLCELLAGLMRPDAGRVSLGGVPLEEIQPDERVEAIALVFQEAFLFGSTVGENLLLGRELEADRLWAALAVAQAASIVEGLPEGLDTSVGERGVTLSGGQRQRLALARALLGRPRLLLLDDATSAVDAAVEAQILDGLRDELEATTLIVAHRQSTIRLADRVALLHGGRIRAAGRHEELLEVPEYAALVRAYEQAGGQS